VTGAMVSPSHLLAFAGAAVVLLLIPGPSVLFVVSRGVAYGCRVALTTVLGNELGICCHVAGVALGVGIIIERSAVVFTIMKLLGAGYLILLGLRAIRNRRSLGDALSASVSTTPGRALRDGFLVGVSNPKSTLFLLAVLPQFVNPSAGHVPLQLLALGLLFLAIAFVTDGAYGVAAGAVRQWLDRSPRRASILGGTSGLVMIGLGIRLAFTGRRD
jgi:threonine/homoserine/homoserine lactone efflux protein